MNQLSGVTKKLDRCLQHTGGGGGRSSSRTGVLHKNLKTFKLSCFNYYNFRPTSFFSSFWDCLVFLITVHILFLKGFFHTDNIYTSL
ncbi:hypothetical protein GDO81_028004 [Engystomops pustulosus]|uniref:Uncharacterized protein n=1 Tax=Engystomops pustulosus TaxID=76066 RepID=A0AAV6YDQ9_ENGPU|nr:hypothetical protein GDO81_028004 [Engystomops pustulosus]